MVAFPVTFIEINIKITNKYFGNRKRCADTVVCFPDLKHCTVRSLPPFRHRGSQQIARRRRHFIESGKKCQNNPQRCLIFKAVNID